MEPQPRLIHAAIGRLSLIFFGQSLRFFFFFFPQTHFEPRAWSPSIFSLTLHLSDLKPSPSPSISNQKPSPHPPSLISTFAWPSISDPKPLPHPPSPISTFASPFNSRLFVFALSRRLGYWRSSLNLPHQVRSLSAFYLILRLLDLVCFSLNLI